MTDTEINQAIAEACGWKPHPVGWCVKHPDEDRSVLVQETARQCEDWKRALPPTSEYRSWVVRQIMSNPPDYCRDLNAIHEAVRALNPQQLCDYSYKLLELVGADQWYGCEIEIGLHEVKCISEATARQRAEAFLRTIGKWRAQ